MVDVVVGVVVVVDDARSGWVVEAGAGAFVVSGGFVAAGAEVHAAATREAATMTMMELARFTAGSVRHFLGNSQDRAVGGRIAAKPDLWPGFSGER